MASCSDTLGVLRLCLVIGSLACVGLAGEADAKVFHSRKDAIALAFPTDRSSATPASKGLPATSIAGSGRISKGQTKLRR